MTRSLLHSGQWVDVSRPTLQIALGHACELLLAQCRRDGFTLPAEVVTTTQELAALGRTAERALARASISVDAEIAIDSDGNGATVATIMTADQAGELLGVGAPRVGQLRRKGELAGVQDDAGQWGYQRCDVEALKAKREAS